MDDRNMDDRNVDDRSMDDGDLSGPVPTVPTSGGTIKLGQFLKLADLAESGAQARELISGGDVHVDGETETRRGRQLSTGALVEVMRPGGVVGARVG